jgi:hypothetical protein
MLRRSVVKILLLSLTVSITLSAAEQVAVEQERASAYVDRSTISEITSNNLVVPNPPKLVRLATEADAEYVAALGGATQANNLS